MRPDQRFLSVHIGDYNYIVAFTKTVNKSTPSLERALPRPHPCHQRQAFVYIKGSLYFEPFNREALKICLKEGEFNRTQHFTVFDFHEMILI